LHLSKYGNTQNWMHSCKL